MLKVEGNRPIRFDDKIPSTEREKRVQEARRLMHTVNPPYIHDPKTPGLIRNPRTRSNESGNKK